MISRIMMKLKSLASSRKMSRPLIRVEDRGLPFSLDGWGTVEAQKAAFDTIRPSGTTFTFVTIGDEIFKKIVPSDILKEPSNSPTNQLPRV